MFLPSNITLQFGDSGDFVSELQRRLATINSHSADAITGMYDGITVNSVSAFQARSGLRADGIAGPETLRKLNGVISGDTSSSDSDKKEEEAAPQYTQAQMVRDEFIAIQPPPEPIQERRNLEERRPDYTPEAPRAEPPVQYPAAPSYEQLNQQALAREQQQAAMHHAQMPQHDLGAMLVQQARPEMREEPRPEHTRPAGVQVLSTHHAPAPQQAAPHQATEQHQPAQEAAKQAPAQQESKGLVGRVMQKLDAFAQKMADYFEAKLPPDVLREVKQAGQMMLQSGVKEVTIPAGPEQVRGQSLPARGPEHQAAQMPQRH